MINACKALVFVIAALLGTVCAIDYFVAWQKIGHPPVLYQRWLAPSYYSEKLLMLLLSYFLIQFIIAYLYNEFSIRKGEREYDSEIVEYECGGRNTLLGIVGMKAYAEAVVILLALTLTWLIGFRVTLPLWHFFMYGVVTGFGGIAIIGLMMVLHPKRCDTRTPQIIISLSYALAVALILHIADFYH